MTQNQPPPAWKRPDGVAEGTWQYVHQGAIARHYDDFVANTPLCGLDERYVITALTCGQKNLSEVFTEFGRSPGQPAQISQIELPQHGPPQCGRDSTPPEPQGFSGEPQGFSRDGGNPVVLDLGCGTGRLTLALRNYGFDVVAIDLSQSMLEAVISHEGKYVPTPTNARPGNVLRLRANLVQLEGLRDAVAEHAICMFSTLGMIQGRLNRRRFLQHVARAVRPAGKLVIHAHRRWAAIREPGGVVHLAGQWLRSVTSANLEFGDSTYAYRGLENMFLHRFSRRELLGDLARTGWQVERLDRVNLTGEGLTNSRWESGGYFVICRQNASPIHPA
jgi:SAM-dependent methyltransferase